jgi:hypothetical protein
MMGDEIANIIWSFYHYVAWYGFRKGIILWMKEVKSGNE